MTWDQVECNWTSLTQTIQERWGRLTIDEIRTVNGKRQRLEEIVQERYGKTWMETRHDIDDFCLQCEPNRELA